MNYEDVEALYVAKFGKKPVFTGRTWDFEQIELIELLFNAIDTGVPYEEAPLEDGQHP